MAKPQKQQHAAPARAANNGAERLPDPPADPQGKQNKTWAAKRLSDSQRALRAITQLLERVEPVARAEKDPQHGPAVGKVAEAVKHALTHLEAAAEGLEGMPQAYVPPSGRTFSPGTRVWITRGTWERKYQGLYEVGELEHLVIVEVKGKIVKAQSPESKVVVVEPAGVFKTAPVSYEGEGEGTGEAE